MNQDVASKETLLVRTPKLSAPNLLDFLDGMDDERVESQEELQRLPMDPVIGEDEVRLRREYVYIFENATVVEAMVVSPVHMQVSACHLRRRKFQRQGIIGFHRNVICFPQHLTELEQLNALWQGLDVYDLVNVCDDGGILQKAMVEAINPDSLQVRLLHDDSVREVHPLNIRQRFTLPWKPTDLHVSHHLHACTPDAPR